MRLLLLLFLFGCSNFEFEEKEEAPPEPILRHSNDTSYALKEPLIKERELYSWEKRFVKGHARITKEFFRCRGSSFALPRKMVNRYGETIYCADCGGQERHSLPVKENKEFVYPILIDLLNYLQEVTEKKVVITCGHRCPMHNIYADLTQEVSYSKHMIGAEVDFYVEGMEHRPMEVARLIMKYYEGREERYSHFYRYLKSDTNVRTKPWYNKEIFLKVFANDEGRDLDNTHNYPYLSIQVRGVLYTWQEAFSGYMRW